MRETTALIYSPKWLYIKDVRTRGKQMRTPVLILPVKGQILRTWGKGGKKWQNLANVLYGWPLN